MRWTKNIITGMILLVLFSQIIFAIGISPAKRDIFFEPNIVSDGSIRIINNKNKEMGVLLTATGELGKYLDLNEEFITFESVEYDKRVSYRVNLPSFIDVPGAHYIDIKATETSSELSSLDQAQVAGISSVISRLKIIVPYPGIYAEASLLITSLKDNVQFAIPISNLGTERIEAFANIEIYEADGKKIDEISTDRLIFASKQVGKLTKYWSAPTIGKYRAKVVVDYGSKDIELEKDFSVGDKFVKISDFILNDFKLGEIAKLEMIITNGWNEPIKDVYADVSIRDKQDISLSKTKTASIDLAAFSDASLDAFLDTNNLDIGNYTIVMKLNYEDKYSIKTAPLRIDESYIEKKIALGQVKAFSLTFVLIIASVLFVIFIVYYFFFLKKSNKKKNK